MKTLLAVAICLAVLCGILGLLMCMASSMVSQAEEKYEHRSNPERETQKTKEENKHDW